MRSILFKVIETAHELYNECVVVVSEIGGDREEKQFTSNTKTKANSNSNYLVFDPSQAIIHSLPAIANGFGFELDGNLVFFFNIKKCLLYYIFRCFTSPLTIRVHGYILYTSKVK